MEKIPHAKPAEYARSVKALPGERIKQLSLGLETDLARPVVALPENIEAEVIGQLAEAIKIVYQKGEEVDHAESRNQ